MKILNLARARAKLLNKGFTLTEIAIVLGIMGLILGAIWVAAAGVYTNQRVNQANTAIIQILQSVRNLYSQGNTMPNSDQSNALIQSGAIPTNLISGSGATAKLQTPWGSPMFVGGDGTGGYVDIELTGMTTALCTGLVMQVFGASHDRTLDSLSTAGSAGITSFSSLTASQTPFSAAVIPTANGTANSATEPSASGTGCTPGATNNYVKLAFGLQG